MNKQGRTRLLRATTQFQNELGKVIDWYREMLESIRDDEQTKYDNLPENLQDGETGDNIQEVIDSIDAVIDELDAETILDDYFNSPIADMFDACGIE